MKISEEQADELVNKRILGSTEAIVKPSSRQPAQGSQTALMPIQEATPDKPEEKRLSTPDFVKIEKDLISLGFFTASSKRVKNVKEKTVTVVWNVDGRKQQIVINIIPSAKYGLPATADQDKYIALKSFIRDCGQVAGEVTNPTALTSAQLNRLLGTQPRQGKNHNSVEEFLQRLFHTGIRFFFDTQELGKKRKPSITVHVLEKLVQYGQELPDGSIADKHYIWFSDWVLRQIRDNKQLPIDREDYKLLKNYIAKALVPHLQIWLYATRDEGIFEKRYDEICQLLGITQYRKLSDILRFFTPSLEELKEHSYISNYKIEETSAGKAYKIIFYHGEKFHRDRRRRLEQREQYGKPRKARLVATSIEPEQRSAQDQATPQIPEQTLNDQERQLFKLLNMEFGVVATKAYELIKTKPEQARAQLEAYSYRNTKPKNPAGWIIEAIEGKYVLPEAYLEYKRKQQEQQKALARRAAIDACTLCNDSGWRLILRTHPQTGHQDEAMKPCTHDPEIESKYPVA